MAERVCVIEASCPYAGDERPNPAVQRVTEDRHKRGLLHLGE